MGLITHIFPIMIGDYSMDGEHYGNYFAQGCHPKLNAESSVTVKSVEDKLVHNFEVKILNISSLITEDHYHN